MASPSSTSHDIALEFPGGSCSLTYESLDLQSIISKCGSPEAGALVSFVGTSFCGKRVSRLEYQAYSKLAIKTISGILQHQKAWASSERSPVIYRAVHHRLGEVPVGEASIVVVVSSPHRKEAFVECEWILEEVKKTAQIWKREFYEGEDPETAEWKANA
ncbi:molybdenum cofactor synthesis 2 [Flagelloscypha sp. PMI_526]|nr:molybdenum cofactor synthesis 2 [Flagelloscypha sp. PMI_526]